MRNALVVEIAASSRPAAAYPRISVSFSAVSSREFARRRLASSTTSGSSDIFAGSKRTPRLAVAKLSAKVPTSERLATAGTMATSSARATSTSTIRRRRSKRSTATPANGPKTRYGRV